MLGKNTQKAPGFPPMFYFPTVKREDIRAGYLIKSPPESRFRSQSSWKRRFFVLYKYGPDIYELKYYKSEEEREKAIKEIRLTTISIMYPGPQNHKHWEWISRNFRLEPEKVLYVHSEGRDFFLIGDNKSEIDGWFSDIYKALVSISPPIRTEHNSMREAALNSDTSDTNIYQPFPDLTKCRSYTEPVPYIPRRTSCPEVQTLPCSESAKQPVPNNHQEQQTHYDTLRNIPATDAKIQSIKEEDNEEDPDRNSPNAYEEMKAVCGMPEESNGQNIYENYPDTVSAMDSMEDVKSALPLASACSEEPVPVEKEISVSREQLKSHLHVTDRDGSPCSVTEWTMAPGQQCVFHHGDQILAVNDLTADSTAELQHYVEKTRKKEVMLTILRQAGSKPFNGSPCTCE